MTKKRSKMLISVTCGVTPAFWSSHSCLRLIHLASWVIKILASQKLARKERSWSWNILCIHLERRTWATVCSNLRIPLLPEAIRLVKGETTCPLNPMQFNALLMFAALFFILLQFLGLITDYDTTVIDCPGMEKLLRWLHKSRLDLASSSTWGICFSWMCCHTWFHRTATRCSLLCGRITRWADGIWRAKDMDRARFISLGMSCISNQKRRSPLCGIKTNQGGLWVEGYAGSRRTGGSVTFMMNYIYTGRPLVVEEIERSSGFTTICQQLVDRTVWLDQEITHIGSSHNSCYLTVQTEMSALILLWAGCLLFFWVSTYLYLNSVHLSTCTCNFDNVKLLNEAFLFRFNSDGPRSKIASCLTKIWPFWQREISSVALFDLNFFWTNGSCRNCG